MGGKNYIITEGQISLLQMYFRQENQYEFNKLLDFIMEDQKIKVKL